ncbi:MAG: cation-transporting P-type ATPase [Mycobacterium sp.]
MGSPGVPSRDPSMRDGVEVARDLGVDPAVGLSSAEAERRLTAEGPNELQPEPPVPLWRTIRRIRTASGEIEFTGVGYRPEGTAQVGDQKPTDPALIHEARMVIAGGSLANDAQLAQRDGEWEI